ncbi:hypothetical protein L5515_019169 [Caenorhabditis briggsae]|uniref:RUN domain-containing protein n=1 Tax=Caenorhabditis briggsae TaxID=6238 RepID=A0AAE9JSU8_CAEBR|nr:hypothetical protein L5515_019169 [Caenorhabditis briggsae]
MYHMLPFAYRPQANYTRAQHGEFQRFVEDCVGKILQESDIIDADHLIGRKLFNSLDAFFSYGLLSADRAYWRCIRTFLPRAEQKMLIAECGNANDRFLSIGWLKTSLNKGTLHFMLLALNNTCNKVYLTKFYHANACIRNNGMLEAITDMVDRLQAVQFAFYSTRQLRAEVAPAAVIETPAVQISSRAAARQRKLTEKEATPDVPNVIPTEIPSLLSQAIDQDVLLDELVRNRHNRLNTELYDTTLQENDEEDGASPSQLVEEKLEDVMTKKMSCAHMESMDPNGIEEILAIVEPNEVSIPEYNLADGEYQMSQGDVLYLAINIFEKSSEKIIECFKVIESFHSDSMKLRYFVMTNYNIYVFKYRCHTHNGSPKNTTNLSSEGFFIPTIRMPHERVKTIKISVDNLAFMVEANEEGFCHFVHSDERDDKTVFSYSAAMAGLECGAHMINSLIQVVEHSSSPGATRVEVDDHIGYMCMLQPNLEKQLRRSLDIRSATLCFWYEQSLDEREQSTATKSGYLFKTVVGNWMKSTEDAEQKYCMIVGDSLHLFTDSNCKDEDMVISLSGATVTNMQRSTFQLKSTDGQFEFECSSHEEQEEWIKILTQIIENKTTKPYMAPCLTVVTQRTVSMVQEGEKFWNDGFLRLLGELRCYDFELLIVAFPPTDKECYFANRSPALCLVTKEGTIHYFFVRFAKELERMAYAMQSSFDIQWLKLDGEVMNSFTGKAIHNTCCSVKNLWPV